MAKARREKKTEDHRGAERLKGEGFMAEIDAGARVLIITIDTSQEGRPSKSGKMMLLASSGGWKKLGDVFFSFNVGRKV